MKIPAEIAGNNKIRDAQILAEYAEKGTPEIDIARKFELSQARVSQIIKKNGHLILTSRDWNKIQRIHMIKSQLARQEVQSIPVSPDKWLDLWRKEYEGENAVNVVNNFLSVEIPTPNRLSESQNRIDK